jgi:hypothetical protein
LRNARNSQPKTNPATTLTPIRVVAGENCSINPCGFFSSVVVVVEESEGVGVLCSSMKLLDPAGVLAPLGAFAVVVTVVVVFVPPLKCDIAHALPPRHASKIATTSTTFCQTGIAATCAKNRTGTLLTRTDSVESADIQA